MVRDPYAWWCGRTGAVRPPPTRFAPVKVSITHTQAVKRVAQAGARGLVMTDFSRDMLVRGGIEAAETRLDDGSDSASFLGRRQVEPGVPEHGELLRPCWSHPAGSRRRP